MLQKTISESEDLERE